jgi:hypothetical protein
MAMTLLLIGLITALWYSHNAGLFHLSLYSSTPGAASTLADVPAVQDPAVTLVNGHPIFPIPIQCIGAYAGGALTLTRAQLSTPKLRAITATNLRPLDVAAVPATRPPLIEYFRHPLSLNPIDENQILASTSAIAATPLLIAIMYGDGNFNVPPGDLFSIHASQSITTVANAWATGPITLDQPLPAGRYAVVGMDTFGTGEVFSRLVFPNQVWRPGGLAGATAAFINTRYSRWGNLGVFGEFETFALPQLDTFNQSGGAQTIDLVMDIIRVA